MQLSTEFAVRVHQSWGDPDKVVDAASAEIERLGARFFGQSFDDKVAYAMSVRELASAAPDPDHFLDGFSRLATPS